MRLANIRGRLSLMRGDACVDVEQLSNGQFAADPQLAFDRWEELCTWASSARTTGSEGVSFSLDELGPPVPRPSQIFAIGLNYDEHAAESGFTRPPAPLVFTKYQSSITGPVTTVDLPTDTVDWEAELVVVIGRECRLVSTDNAWAHVAGVTVGQDISERTSQHAGPAPQFGLAKSFPGFSPIGPFLVTPEEFDEIDNLAIDCLIDGRTVQQGRTASMIFPVPELVAHLSSIVTLYPGDLIFTGTPSGVGAGQKPPVFLRAGQVLTSRIEGIGALEQTFTGGPR